jgi:hypothetical protein
MMNDHQTALCSLLLGSFPNFSSGDSEGALGSYALVMARADQQDLEPGVMILINGEYPGHDGRFAPTAPQLATAIRMARDKRLESERRTKLSQPQLMAPDIQRTPEERARVKAKIDGFLADQVVEQADPEAIKRRNEQWAKTNARFMPDMSPEAMHERLVRKRGYSVGDPEDHADAA